MTEEQYKQLQELADKECRKYTSCYDGCRLHAWGFACFACKCLNGIYPDIDLEACLTAAKLLGMLPEETFEAVIDTDLFKAVTDTDLFNIYNE